MKEIGYRPGREFGCSDRPKIIYVALRWNSRHPDHRSEEQMLDWVAKTLKQRRVQKADRQFLRIYNLLPPREGMGMALSLDDLGEVEKTISHIKDVIDDCQSVQLIVVGGRSGPMPLVALLLKHAVPKIPIQIRNHHRARPGRHGLKPLALARNVRL
ncbi:MAG: hypothetical protein ACLQBA_24855 [Candidatus Binataceae bacterium]